MRFLRSASPAAAILDVGWRGGGGGDGERGGASVTVSLKAERQLICVLKLLVRVLWLGGNNSAHRHSELLPRLPHSHQFCRRVNVGFVRTGILCVSRNECVHNEQQHGGWGQRVTNRVCSTSHVFSS